MMKRNIFQICLWVAMLLTLAVSARASTLDEIGAQAVELKFYEASLDGVPFEARTYSGSYEKQSTRYICFELSLEYPAPGAMVDIPLTIQYLRSDGSVYGQWNTTFQLQADWTYSWHSSGWGSNTKGNWEPGKYTVKISDSARQIASGSFTVYTDGEAADIILNWLESLVPGITHQTTMETNGIYYRYWPDIKYYVGTYLGNLLSVNPDLRLDDWGLVNYWLAKVESDSTASVVGEFSSGSAGGVISTGNGSQIFIEQDTIPNKQDGTPATVKFTIETGVEPPVPVPQEFDQIGNITKFGPDGFSFAWPVTTAIPVPNSVADLTGIQLLKFYSGQGKWFPVPMMAYNDDGQKVTSLTDSAYELGYATLAQSSTSNRYNLAVEDDTCNGAFRWYVSSSRCPGISTGGTQQGCHYYFVPISFTPKYPGQLSLYPDGWQDDAILRTGSNPTGAPVDKTVFSLLQGTWEFCLTASEYTIPGSSLPLPGKWTYQKPVQVTINHCSRNQRQSINGFDGWSNIVGVDGNAIVLDSANWKEPSESTFCPTPTNTDPTVSVCSGDFQATLTWSNTESKQSDVDLHLYGPDGLHIYYGNEVQSNLTLDRDYQDEIGNAIENICDSGPMPKGTYKLAVQLYGGASPTSYSVRVIQEGNTVKTYEKTISDYGLAGEQTILEFTVN